MAPLSLRALYRRAAIAQRDYDRVTKRLDNLDIRIDRRVESGRDAWALKQQKKRVLGVALDRRIFFETARFEARDRMLFDEVSERDVERHLEGVRRYANDRKRKVS